MKRDILERYERNSNNKIIIDIAAQKVEDLYDDFDKRAHFLKKDLNQDLVEYIKESVTEIGNEAFIIQFSFENKIAQESLLRVQNSIKNFFIYMQELEMRAMKEKMRISIILIIIGLFFTTLSVLMNQSEIVEKSITLGVIAEGLTVAAWVSLWEALATFLIKWMPHNEKIALYKRIADTEVTFKIL